jgi:hypothetical protein
LTTHAGDGILNYSGKLWGGEAAKDSIPATLDDNLPQIASFQSDRQLPAVRMQRQAQQLPDSERMLTH